MKEIQCDAKDQDFQLTASIAPQTKENLKYEEDKGSSQTSLKDGALLLPISLCKNKCKDIPINDTATFSKTVAKTNAEEARLYSLAAVVERRTTDKFWTKDNAAVGRNVEFKHCLDKYNGMKNENERSPKHRKR